jgi:hypothetical protein
LRGIGDPILRESYLTAARELLDKNRDHLLQVALPILFLQRHALELALKHSVRVLVGFRQVTLEPKSLRRHNLKHLLRDFKKHLADDQPDKEALALMESLVARFHRIDRPGTWARYRDDAEPVSLDLGEHQRELEELFRRLFARPRGDEDLGWIAEYEEAGLREYLDGEEAA